MGQRIEVARLVIPSIFASTPGEEPWAEPQLPQPQLAPRDARASTPGIKQEDEDPGGDWGSEEPQTQPQLAPEPQPQPQPQPQLAPELQGIASSSSQLQAELQELQEQELQSRWELEVVKKQVLLEARQKKQLLLEARQTACKKAVEQQAQRDARASTPGIKQEPEDEEPGGDWGSEESSTEQARTPTCESDVPEEPGDEEPAAPLPSISEELPERPDHGFRLRACQRACLLTALATSTNTSTVVREARGEESSKSAMGSCEVGNWVRKDKWVILARPLHGV